MWMGVIGRLLVVGLCGQSAAPDTERYYLPVTQGNGKVSLSSALPLPTLAGLEARR